MNRLRRAAIRIAPGALAAVTIAVVGWQLGSSAARAVVVVAFYLLAPGGALLAWARPDRAHTAIEWFVAMAIGVAILIVIGEGQVLVREWVPRGSTLAVAVMVLVLTFLPRHFARSRSRQEARTP